MGERVGEFGTVTVKSLNRAISSHTQAQPPAPGPRLAGRQKNWLAASVWMDERNLWAVEMKHMQSDGYKLFGWWERDASRGKVWVREGEVRLAHEESGRKQHEKKRRVKKKQHWKEPWGGVTSTDLFHWSVARYYHEGCWNNHLFFLLWHIWLPMWLSQASAPVLLLSLSWLCTLSLLHVVAKQPLSFFVPFFSGNELGYYCHSPTPHLDVGKGKRKSKETHAHTIQKYHQ